MKAFEVGRFYDAEGTGVSPIKILRRTNKTVWVRNDCSEWRMRIKVYNGMEYVEDSSVPYRWRECYTYCANRQTDNAYWVD